MGHKPWLHPLRRDLSGAPATLAATAWTFGGWCSAYLQLPSYAWALCLFPFILLGIGLIYGITEASDLIAQGDADDDTALFECEWGSEGTKHVALHDVDFFCTPRVRARLELALLQAHIGAAMEGGAA